jgi:hypothetical protein
MRALLLFTRETALFIPELVNLMTLFRLLVGILCFGARKLGFRIDSVLVSK